jgi:Zn-dependent protease with chaperone function
MPEVAIYDGEPNAFATGATKNSSLVAVSTGLLHSMTRDEAEAVLAHEVAHIANGDMVTLTLIQGVVNTFVVFLSRIVGYVVDGFLRRNDGESSGPGIGYMVTSMICEVVFGVLASIIVAWFSRQREFRADAGAAGLMGSRRADAECPAPPGQPAHRTAAAEHGGLRYRRGQSWPVRHPSAAGRAHRCAGCTSKLTFADAKLTRN